MFRRAAEDLLAEVNEKVAAGASTGSSDPSNPPDSTGDASENGAKENGAKEDGSNDSDQQSNGNPNDDG